MDFIKNISVKIAIALRVFEVFLVLLFEILWVNLTPVP